ncbi:MAG: hypothetical protein CML46_19055 [Rhodobacteraceae bacterium]|nr:hypothetical protein [Paracoccaceae bacterium]
MYAKNDPRASLAAAASGPARTGLIVEPQVGDFERSPPTEDRDGVKSWHIRGANGVLVWSRCAPGATLVRAGQVDEYVAILPAARADIRAGADRAVTEPNTIAMIPPGASAITLRDGGDVCRLFTTRSADMLALCPNAGAYDAPRTHIPPFAPWPEPAGGLKLRTYSIDVPAQEGRFGRIFRCTTFMVNMLYPSDGPRDTTKMSPHHHDDFEQFSLAISGGYDHHMRWPWTTDMADWRPDRTITVGAPSVCVIPPPVIHTSRASDAGTNQLVDIFCPPRADFSAKPGWVLNADDYPAPEGV